MSDDCNSLFGEEQLHRHSHSSLLVGKNDSDDIVVDKSGKMFSYISYAIDKNQFEKEFL